MDQSFDPGVWQEADWAERPRAGARAPVAFTGQLRDRQLSRVKVRVDDLSRSGFRGEAERRFHIGERVFLALPGLAGQEAEIKWARHFSYGFAFVTPLHDAVFQHIVRISEGQAAR